MIALLFFFVYKIHMKEKPTLEELIKQIESMDKGESYRKMMLSCMLGNEMEWEHWRKKIPSIQFPVHWKVKIVPPFAAAVVRFTVTTEKIKDPDAHVSVYLDCYSALGCYFDYPSGKPKPYWEAYPIDADTERYAMEDIAGLLEAIERGLKILESA